MVQPQPAILDRFELWVEGVIGDLAGAKHLGFVIAGGTRASVFEFRDVLVVSDGQGRVWFLSVLGNKRLLMLRRQGRRVLAYTSDGRVLGFVVQSPNNPKYPRLPDFINKLLGVKPRYLPKIT